MDGLLNRVIEGRERVMQQVVEFFEKATQSRTQSSSSASSSHPSQTIEERNIYDEIDKARRSCLRAPLSDGELQQSDFVISDSPDTEQHQASYYHNQYPTSNDEATRNRPQSLRSNSSHRGEFLAAKEGADDGHHTSTSTEEPQNLHSDSTEEVHTGFSTENEQDTAEDLATSALGARYGPQTDLPITSKYTEIIKFRGKYGFDESALSLTKMMLWEMNNYFSCEAKMARYKQEMDGLQERKAQLERIILNLEQNIAENLEDDHASDVGHLEEAHEIERLTDVRREQLMAKGERTHNMVEGASRRLFRELKEVLSIHQLLDPPPADSEIGSAAPEEENHGYEEQPTHETEAPTSPTPSEVARRDYAEERDIAEDNAHNIEIHLQDVQRKLENWQDYYEYRRREYNHCREQGTTESTVTAFDNQLLMEHSETIADLIQTEKDLKAAHSRLRALGLVRSDMSGDYYDDGREDEDRGSDGYRESMEKSWIEHVNRGWIETWAAQCEEDDGTPLTADVDDWEMEDVGNSDSVSMVALGKERMDIDRWTAMREMIDLTAIKEDDNPLEDSNM